MTVVWENLLTLHAVGVSVLFIWEDGRNKVSRLLCCEFDPGSLMNVVRDDIIEVVLPCTIASTSTCGRTTQLLMFCWLWCAPNHMEMLISSKLFHIWLYFLRKTVHFCKKTKKKEICRSLHLLLISGKTEGLMSGIPLKLRWK